MREADYALRVGDGVGGLHAPAVTLISFVQGVYVPEMCVELTTRRVLVMEWVDGVRLRSAASGAALPRGRDDLKLVEIGVHCSLEQACSC